MLTAAGDAAGDAVVSMMLVVHTFYFLSRGLKLSAPQNANVIYRPLEVSIT